MSRFRSGVRGLRSNRRGIGALIDLTPLIDITFQLLIFFLLTATFQTNPSFKVKLPKAKNTDITQEPKTVTVMISSEGGYEVDGKAVDQRELELRLCTVAQENAGTSVNIKADETTDHKFVVEVMDKAKGCGLEKLGILHR